MKNWPWIAMLLGLLGWLLACGCAHLDEDRSTPAGHLNVQESRYGIFYLDTMIREDRLTRYGECLRERETQLRRTGHRWEDAQAVCFCETTARNAAELQACAMGLRVAVSGTWGTPAYGAAWMAASTTGGPMVEKKRSGAEPEPASAQAVQRLAQTTDSVIKAFKALKAAFKAHVESKGGTP